MEFLNNKSIDYFHGRISIINKFDIELSKKLRHYLKIVLANKQTHNYAHYTQINTHDFANNADFTFKIEGQADWALTDHLFDVFMQPLNEQEREEFYDLLLNNPSSVFIDVDEYEKDRYLLHEASGYLTAYRDDDGNPQLYIKDYYYDDFDFTAYNIANLQFEKGIYENSREYLRLDKELVLSKPVNAIWKNHYHRDKIDLLFAVRALIRDKNHQGVILQNELKDTKIFLAKANKALRKSQQM